MSKTVSKDSEKETSNYKPLAVTLVRSLLGRPDKQRRVAKALGLTKSNQTVHHADTPIIRGMINKISHLLTVTTEVKA